MIFVLVYVYGAAATAPLPQAKESGKKSAEQITGESESAFPPDFTLAEAQKKTSYTLSSYRGRQPVLLFFWTTWCPFCQKALSSLSDTYPELVKDGVEVLAINVGEPGSRVERAAQYYKLSLPVLLDEQSTVIRSYGLLGVPTYILINKEGRVIFQDNYLPRRRLQDLLKE